MLVDLETAKSQLNMDHDLSDELIELQIAAASGAVLNYLKQSEDLYVDSSGDLIIDSNGESAVPAVVKQAVLFLVGSFFVQRTGETGVINPQWSAGYLPAPVTALLYPLRDPTLA
jgi:hypothetical protein